MKLFIFVACAIVLPLSAVSGPIDSLLPNAVVQVLDQLPNLPEASVVDLNEELKKLATNLSNLRGTSTSVASALLSAQAVHAELSELLEYVQSVRNQGLETDVEMRLKELEQALRTARDQVGEIGSSLETLLTNGGGTDALLRKLVEDVSELVSAIKFLRPVSGLEIGEVLRRLGHFGKGEFWKSFWTRSEVENQEDEKFEVVDDLPSADLSRDKVLQIVDLRGGFGVPIKLPAGLGELNLTKDGFNQQFIDLKNKKISGEIGENLGLETKLKIPGIAGLEGISGNGIVTNIFGAKGEMDLTKLHGDFVNDIDLKQELDLGRLGSGSLGFGSRNELDGKLENGIGDLVGVGTSGSGIEFENALGSGGVGSGGNFNGNINIGGGIADLGLFESSSGGGGLSIGEKIKGSGGFGENGLLESNLNLKDLTGSNKIYKNSGLGGNLLVGESSLGGGLGNTLDGQSFVDIKNGIVNVDLLSQVGTDGKIKLPGNLGGLVYDISDVTDIVGHLKIGDLSALSLDILKQTDILAIVDLPGDKLDDIKIEAHPKIDTSKLGQLNVLGFAAEFAEDVKNITEFNMLGESNLLKAIKSGIQFLARLDILDALRKDIGSIRALPEVVARVKSVLRDMQNILGCLKRVQLFPGNVRLLGDALAKFDVGELLVELPQLEALELPAKKFPPGGDFVAELVEEAEEKLKNEEKAAQAIPDAAKSLADFRLHSFLEASDLTAKITGAAENILKIQNINGGGGIKLGESLINGLPVLTNGLGALGAVAELGDVVQSISGLDVEKVLKVAEFEGIDLNEIGNLDVLMNLTGLDSSFRTPLENLMKIASLQEVELNEILNVADLAKLNLNNIEDLSDILDTDLIDLDLFDSGLTTELDRLLLEPLEDILTDSLGNAVLDIDVGDLNLAEIVESATGASLDINDLADLEKIGELVGLNDGRLVEMEKLVRAANWNGVDLSKVPSLAAIADLDLNRLDDLQTIVGNADIGKALEVLDVSEVGGVLKGITGSLNVSNVVGQAELRSNLNKLVEGLGNRGNAEHFSKIASEVMRSDLASGVASSFSSILKSAIGNRRLMDSQKQKEKEGKIRSKV
eukprot:GHVS01074000.1.p1 GENE.GHVS01074000.1~~GHVS01074000.1.p1  ORF type:complete len:1092 (+),score=196.03 GHVS01074000.1:250-3525(+)